MAADYGSNPPFSNIKHTREISIRLRESPDHKQNYQNKKLKPTNKDCIGLKYKKQQLQK